MTLPQRLTSRLPDPRQSRPLLHPQLVVLACHTSGAFAAGVSAIFTARALGASGRGIVVLVATTVALGVVLGTCGVNLAGRTRLSAKDGNFFLASYLFLAVVLSAVTFATVAGTVQLFFPLISAPLPEMLAFLAAGQAALTLMSVFLVDAVYAFGVPLLAALSEATGPAAQVLLTLSLFLSGADQVWQYVAAMFAAAGIQLAFAAMCLRRQHPLSGVVRASSVKELLRTGLTATPAQLSRAAATRIDRYLVSGYLGAAALGVYSVAYTIAELMLMPALAYGRVLWQRVASGHYPEARLGRPGLTVAIGLSPVMGLLVVLTPWLEGLFGQEFQGLLPLVATVLGVGMVAAAMTGVDSTVLSARGEFGVVSRTLVVGLITAIVTSLVLIPLYALPGAAVASSFASVVTAALTRISLSRRMRIWCS